MIIHRYLFAHYRQVAVYFWPILFWNLWRVDLWCAETGRQAFVQVDRYGRAWVPYFEGMGVNHMTHNPDERFYAPSEVENLCPQIFEHAITQLSADASAPLRPARLGGWGLRTTLTNALRGAFLPWTPAYAGVDGEPVRLEPG
ncbi:MAG: hypothetical protein AAFR92_00405 [Pseudomonadota bacterium]